MNRRFWKRVVFWSTTFAISWAPFAAAVPLYEVTPLPLPPGNYLNIYPTDINNQGQVVGWVEKALTARGFSFIGGQYSLLPPLSGSNFSYAEAVNNLGQIVGSTQNEDGIPKAAFWSSGTAAAQELETSGGNSANAYATDINDSSQISGFYTTSGSGNVSSWEGIRWTRDERGRFTSDDLQQPTLPSPSVYTSAYGINNAGEIVGTGPTLQPDASQAPLRWSPTNSVQELDVTNPDILIEFRAVAINDLGVSVGWGTGSAAEATPLRWDAEQTVTLLGFPPGSTDTQAVDINNDEVIVGTSISNAESHAVGWFDGEWVELSSRILNNPGWTLTTSAAINDAGQIVGTGRLNGETLGYVLTPLEQIPGDFDLDGDVDGRDFLIWQRNTSVGNLSDWQTNYGTGMLTASSGAVPEPGSLILIVGGVFALVGCRLLPALGRYATYW